MSAFGKKLRELRTAAGLTQKTLAEQVDMHELSVYRLESGAREPNWSTVQRLAAALGVPCTAFQESVEKAPR